MDLNELRMQVAQILSEAKKKKVKGEKLKKETGCAKSAYGIYDEEFDFSTPLGPYNLYKQQGGVNFGPYTSAGVDIDSSFKDPGHRLREHEEVALRRLIREVIENGLITEESAWAPMMGRREPLFESPWDEAAYYTKKEGGK